MPNTYYSSRSPDATIVLTTPMGVWADDPPSRARVINNPRREHLEAEPGLKPLTRDEVATRLSKATRDVTDREYEDEVVVWAIELAR